MTPEQALDTEVKHLTAAEIRSAAEYIRGALLEGRRHFLAASRIRELDRELVNRRLPPLRF